MIPNPRHFFSCRPKERCLFLSNGRRLHLYTKNWRKFGLIENCIVVFLAHLLVAKSSFSGRFCPFGALDLLHSKVLVFHNLPSWSAYFRNILSFFCGPLLKFVVYHVFITLIYHGYPLHRLKVDIWCLSFLILT